jgi:hypothetical protein
MHVSSWESIIAGSGVAILTRKLDTMAISNMSTSLEVQMLG